MSQKIRRVEIRVGPISKLDWKLDSKCETRICSTDLSTASLTPVHGVASYCSGPSANSNNWSVFQLRHPAIKQRLSEFKHHALRFFPREILPNSAARFVKFPEIPAGHCYPQVSYIPRPVRVVVLTTLQSIRNLL